MSYIDLHMHTDYSDGACTADEVLEMVRSSGISAFSITDHDTLGGYRHARTALRPGDPELVSGVELSVLIGEDDVHVLAYLFDPDDKPLNNSLLAFQQKRHTRGQQIVEKLQNLGVDVAFDAVTETADGSVIGRPHVAETLHRLNKVGSYQEAFDKYIGRKGPAYVPKVLLEPQAAIDMVHAAGGVAILAHPFIDDMARHIPMLTEMGLDGLEVKHSNHTAEQAARLERIAAKHRLAVSGGSDFHGREGRHGAIGSQRVPALYLQDLKKRAAQNRGRL
ncbi:phosphatase [candidate division GN15 bacterium]|uniref:Phosphatase n=1 Tax=candidate division GN15 bacterium TaxID=2072418 RepID=A0A855X2Y6_9BACT|nr:MAG: phosphatase [candidate division GN15 bacterium]